MRATTSQSCRCHAASSMSRMCESVVDSGTDVQLLCYPQAELGALKAVPVLFASVNGLHLAEPPEQAKAAIAAGHAAAQALPKHELQTEALKDLNELRPRDEGYKKFRRRKIKGPNPLAVKKKRQKPSTHAAAGQAAATTAAAREVTDGQPAGGKRKRKKRKEGTAPASNFD